MPDRTLPRSTSALVDAASEHLIELTEDRHPGILSELATRPLEAIPGLLDITVDVRPETRSASSCGVDGSYFTNPARISVADSASVRRQYFTVLHELGHHLADDSDAVFDAVTSIRDPQKAQATSEAICDAFAARVLIPTEVRDEVIPDRGPSAADVAELYQRTQASRSACCAAAARRLGADGYVILATTTGVIRYAAQARPTYVIAPGTQQAEQSVLARAGSSLGGRSSDTDRLTYATGTQSPYYHADAVRDGDYVFGVYTDGHPPWRPPNALVLRPTDGPTATEYICDFCDEPFQAFGRPCDRCGDHHCPRCDRCTTGKVDVDEMVVCRSCYLKKPPNLINADRICVDCS